jgi:hypothetical protein
MSVGKAKRQSTTAKITWANMVEFEFVFGYSAKEFGDGFIARVRGVEFAIVGVFRGYLIPCPVLHPGIGQIEYRLATIRKGLI